MDRVAGDQLPSTMGYEWTELSFQELEAEKDLLAKLVFPLAVAVCVHGLGRPVLKAGRCRWPSC